MSKQPPLKTLCTCIGKCGKDGTLPKGTACRLDAGKVGTITGKCGAAVPKKENGSRVCNADAPLREVAGKLSTVRAHVCNAHTQTLNAQGYTVRTILNDELPLS